MATVPSRQEVAVQVADPSPKQLVEILARQLVDHPDWVKVREVTGEETVVFEIDVHPDDLGKLIGKQGKNVRSIRQILLCVGAKMDKRFRIEVMDE